MVDKGRSDKNHVKFQIDDERLGKSLSDVTAGIMMAGALTQWTGGVVTQDAAGTATVNGYTPPSAAVSGAGAEYWDWGMGWGWSGNSASYCGTCALEQAALMSQNRQVVSTALPELNNHHQSMDDYLNNFDDDQELGELGEATDVGCDFGDFGAF